MRGVEQLAVSERARGRNLARSASQFSTHSFLRARQWSKTPPTTTSSASRPTPTRTRSAAHTTKARSCHPDKFPGDAAKEAEFKALSEAYQTLFDDTARAAYDRYGKQEGGAPNFADARDVFAATFGARSLSRGSARSRWRARSDEGLQNAAATTAAAAMAKRQEIEAARAEQRPADEVRLRAELAPLDAAAAAAAALQEAHKAAQALRVQQLAALLKARVEGYVAAAVVLPAEELASVRDAFSEGAREDFTKLAACNLGEPMLEAIGYVYVRQTQKRMAKMSGGLRGVVGVFEEGAEFVHNVSEGLGAFGRVIGMASAAIKLHKDEAAAEGAAGKLSEEQKLALTEKVAESVLYLLWKLTRRDVEETLREVVDHALGAELIRQSSVPGARVAPLPEVRARAEAIGCSARRFSHARAFNAYQARDASAPPPPPPPIARGRQPPTSAARPPRSPPSSTAPPPSLRRLFGGAPRGRSGSAAAAPVAPPRRGRRRSRRRRRPPTRPVWRPASDSSLYYVRTPVCAHASSARARAANSRPTQTATPCPTPSPCRRRSAAAAT